jgi:hypothetical protein
LVVRGPEQPWTDAEQLAGLRSDWDPVVQALARGELRAGSSVEAVRNCGAGYTIEQYGRYTVIQSPWTGYGGTTLIALDGRLVRARLSSCIIRRTFFEPRPGGWNEPDYHLFLDAWRAKQARLQACMVQQRNEWLAVCGGLGTFTPIAPR